METQAPMGFVKLIPLVYSKIRACAFKATSSREAVVFQ